MEPAKAARFRRTLVVANPKAKLFDQVTEVCRLLHYSRRTEQTYVGWIRRFLLFHRAKAAGQWRHPRELGGQEVTEFLSHLAVAEQVSASTQNQALNAPWFVAQVSYHVPGDEASPDIRAAQASLWKTGLALEGPDSDALKGELRERGGQGVHFSGPGLRVHATKWVEKVAPWLENQLARPQVP